MLLGSRQHVIILTVARNLSLGYPRTIKKFNETLHTRFVKHDIYQKIHYIHNRDIYPLPTHLAWEFERLDKLITHLMYSEDKQCRRKITGRVKWSPEYKKEMDLVELWVLLKTRYGKHCYNGQ